MNDKTISIKNGFVFVLILRSRQDRSHWLCSIDPNINIKVNLSLHQKLWFKTSEKSAQKIAFIPHFFQLKNWHKIYDYLWLIETQYKLNDNFNNNKKY
jgi:hypothetical protein